MITSEKEMSAYGRINCCVVCGLDHDQRKRTFEGSSLIERGLIRKWALGTGKKKQGRPLNVLLLFNITFSQKSHQSREYKTQREINA